MGISFANVKTNWTHPFSKEKHYRTEYTRKCGFIDWSHATPDRKDLATIWSQLPHTVLHKDHPKLELYTIDLQIPKKRKRRLNYYRVTWSTLKARRHFTFYVLNRGGIENEHWYKRAALALFEFSCEVDETSQNSLRDLVVTQSSFSMEDLVSNLIAFFGLINGLNRKSIIEKCHGWQDPEEAQSASVTSLAESLGFGDQPRSKGQGFRKAYLFNDRANFDDVDKRGGWQSIPPYFHQVLPLTIWPPGISRQDHDILSEWDNGTLFRLDGAIVSHKRIAESPLTTRRQFSAPLSRQPGRPPGPIGVYESNEF